MEHKTTLTAKLNDLTFDAIRTSRAKGFCRGSHFERTYATFVAQHINHCTFERILDGEQVPKVLVKCYAQKGRLESAVLEADIREYIFTGITSIGVRFKLQRALIKFCQALPVSDQSRILSGLADSWPTTYVGVDFLAALWARVAWLAMVEDRRSI